MTTTGYQVASNVARKATAFPLWRAIDKQALKQEHRLSCVLHDCSDASTNLLDHLFIIINIIRPRRSRSAAAYSHQPFPWTICRSVCRSVCLSSALWKNGGSDPDAIRHHRSDGSRDEADSGVWGWVHGKGYFWGRIWGAPLSTGTYRTYMCYSVARRPSYVGQTCYYK